MAKNIAKFKPLNALDDRLAPIIYVIDSEEHPFEISDVAEKAKSTVVSIPIRDWNDSLTPWPSPGFYENDPWFGGHAAETLDELCRHVIPAVESDLGITPRRRGICGYSLGGLFALYVFTGQSPFDACACISGSLWYAGWMRHLRELDLGNAERVKHGFAFFSVGKKERKSGLPLFRCVEDNMKECAAILGGYGCRTEIVVGPGNHMQHIPERFERAFDALDEFLLA